MRIKLLAALVLGLMFVPAALADRENAPEFKGPQPENFTIGVAQTFRASYLVCGKKADALKVAKLIATLGVDGANPGIGAIERRGGCAPYGGFYGEPLSVSYYAQLKSGRVVKVILFTIDPTKPSEDNEVFIVTGKPVIGSGIREPVAEEGQLDADGGPKFQPAAFTAVKIKGLAVPKPRAKPADNKADRLVVTATAKPLKKPAVVTAPKQEESPLSNLVLYAGLAFVGYVVFVGKPDWLKNILGNLKAGVKNAVKPPV